MTPAVKKESHMNRRVIIAAALFILAIFTPAQAAAAQKDDIFNGLYAWLPLDGDAADIGPNRFTTDAKGPVPAVDRLGRAKGALHFDGKDDFINLGMDINASEMEQLTVAVWCRPEQPTGVLFGHDNGYWDRGFGLLDQDRYRGLYVNGGTDGKWFGGIKLSLNQWHLVIVTYDAVSGTAGVHSKTDKLHSVIAKAAHPGAGWHFTQIGRSETFNAPFKGSLDNVVVWNRILTQDEVAHLLNHPETLDNSPMLEMVNEQNEIKKLFAVGFFEAGAKKYKEVLARAGTNALWINNTDRMLEIMKGAPLKLQGEVFLSHGRALLSLEKKAATRYGIQRLMDYGILAAYAGHPDLTRAAAMQISAVQNPFASDLIPSFGRQAAAILNALATSMEQGPDAAYQIILDCGKLNPTVQRYILDNSQYLAPFFSTPKKIACLLDKTRSELPKTVPFPVQKQAYLALDGTAVQAGARTPAPAGSGTIPPTAQKLTQTAAQGPGPFKEDPLFNGLYAWFPLDGNAEDIGPNQIKTALQGPVPATDRTGKAGRALFFDGKNDFIKLFMNVNPSKMPQLSVALWVMPEREWGVLFCHDNGNWDRSVTIENLKEIKGLTCLAGPRVKYLGGAELPQNRWHLVLATWNAQTGTARLYTRDHKFDASNAHPGEGWPYTQLGKSPSFGGEFLGRMDNVVVWNRELSSAEAKRLMAHPELIDNAPRLAVARQFNDARNLFQAGFFQAGAEQYIAALDRAGTTFLEESDFQRLLDDMKGVPLHIQGNVLISHYRSLFSMGQTRRLNFAGVDDPKGIRVTHALPVKDEGIRQGDIITQVNGRQVKPWAEEKKALTEFPPGTVLALTVLRDGSVRRATGTVVASQPYKATAFGIKRLVAYGMLAAYAGHPVMTRAAAQQILITQNQFPLDVYPFYYKETAAILNALASAMEQGPDAGYKILLECGKLHPSTQSYITDFPRYAAPLYANPQKLAYLLETQASNLPKPPPFPSGKQTFVSLEGKRIGPGDGVPVLEGSGSPSSPKSAPKAKGTVLD